MKKGRSSRKYARRGKSAKYSKSSRRGKSSRRRHSHKGGIQRALSPAAAAPQ